MKIKENVSTEPRSEKDPRTNEIALKSSLRGKISDELLRLETRFLRRSKF